MARRSRIKAARAQKRYRTRLAKYEAYKASTLEPKSFKEWNEPYRQNKFLRKEFKLYKEKFAARKKAAGKRGFRMVEGEEVQTYSTFSDFKNQYLLTRNSLREEVEMGERERVGSVITEMINDQAYELSAAKARGVARYLLENEAPLLEQKGLITTYIDEEGNEQRSVKSRKLNLLIRQGSFVREEVGLWEEIKDFYKTLINEGYTAQEAKKEIGQTYWDSK